MPFEAVSGSDRARHNLKGVNLRSVGEAKLNLSKWAFATATRDQAERQQNDYD
jgi:hypothetical protein